MQAGPTIGQWYFDGQGNIVMNVPSSLDFAGGGGSQGDYPMYSDWTDPIYDPSSAFASTGGGGSSSGGGLGAWIGSLFGGDPGSGLPISIGGGSGAPDTSETLTQIVNALETQLKANLAAWQVQQTPTDTAVSNGWALMNQLVSRCAAYGAEGLKATAERDRRVNPAQLRWDWIAYYIDPLTGGATSPAPLPTTVTPAGTTLPGGTVPGGLVGAGIGIGGNGNELLIFGFVAVFMIWLSKR